MNAQPFVDASLAGRTPRVLLVEDEDLFARAVAKRLQKAGYQCELAQTLAEGRAIARQFSPDLVLLDMRLPDGNGLELLTEFSAAGLPVIVMTAHGDIGDAVQAMKRGAVDYLKKPFDLDELLLTIEKAQRADGLKRQLDHSRERDSKAAEGGELVGESVAMRTVRAQIAQIARLSALTEATAPTVLITGETGTGKDVAAHQLHQLGAGAARPFVQVDCASLPADLIESELFGHEKGAFTSAAGTRCGLIEAAEDGTLFLDEVGELPLALQAKLLNVLERRMVRRLGATRERPVPARFIAATNRDLQQMVIDGRFRSDLFYRLHVLTLTMPPLRAREGDALLLARFFLAQTERRYGLPARQFSAAAMEAISRYHWPGNVRELKNLIDRAALLAQGGEIGDDDLGLNGKAGQGSHAAAPVEGLTIDAAERLLMQQALDGCGGNVSEAARRLGLTRMAMRYRMDKHGFRHGE